MSMLADYQPDLAGIRKDVEALAAISRSSARPGELHSADLLADRLAEQGVLEVPREKYRYQRSYALAHGVHTAAGLAACALGGWRGLALGAGALASFEREVSGRSQWVRGLLPGGEGRNVIGRIPPRGNRRATLVLLAHHDAANTGFVWNPRLAQAGAARRLRRRRVDPFMAPIELAFVMAGLGNLMPCRFRAGTLLRAGTSLRAAAGLLFAASLATDIDIGRGATVPGASDNATGVAVALDLVRALAAQPPEGLEVLVALVGSEEAGMGGMRAFLDAYEPRLREGSAFVLGLDTLGAGTPIVCSGEGAMREQHYARQDLTLVDEGAALAGIPAPQRWRIGAWTDPILAVHRGFPAASLLSIGPSGNFPNYHLPTDTPDRVDWSSVTACARLAAGCVRAYERREG